MKILLIGDYSNCHSTLAKALNEMGHQAVVASNGNSWMETSRDIDLSRPYRGKSGGALLLTKIAALSGKLKGFDVVQINNPIFLDLRPERIKRIFDKLRQRNGSVFLTMMGTDSYYFEMCLNDRSALRYNEWMIEGEPTAYLKANPDKAWQWQNPPLSSFCQYVYDNIDGVVTALYEYDLSVHRILPSEKIAYAGIPIDTRSIVPNYIDEAPQTVKLFLGMHSSRKIEKGTDRIYAAADKLAKRYPDRCKLEIVENLPYAEYIRRMRGAHVVLDQLYSYSPATNALLAMAMGLATLSGGEPEYYDFINEHRLHPTINAIPDDEKLYETLEGIVLNPESLISISRQGRELVEKHNDSHVVAQRYLDFWEKRLNSKR